MIQSHLCGHHVGPRTIHITEDVRYADAPHVAAAARVAGDGRVAPPAPGRGCGRGLEQHDDAAAKQVRESSSWRGRHCRPSRAVVFGGGCKCCGSQPQ